MLSRRSFGFEICPRVGRHWFIRNQVVRGAVSQRPSFNRNRSPVVIYVCWFGLSNRPARGTLIANLIARAKPRQLSSD